MRALLHLATLAIIAGLGFAQAPPKASELVERALDFYSKVTTASFTQTITSGTVKMKFAVSGELPDKMRLEMDDTTARLTDFGENTGGVIVIGNGTKQFTRFLGPNTYRVLQLETEASRMRDMLPPFGLAFDIEKSRYLPDEVIDAAPCYVLELVERKPPGEPQTYRWWIEQSTEKVIRAERLGGNSTSLVTFENLHLNEQLPPETFVFKPSPGSRQIE
ncbi:MAG: hypothetical protein ABIR70_19310 [Bryobacteraceae bacterium]